MEAIDEGKSVRFATVGRPTMSRSHLALNIETPLWTGSPQGVVCFPSQPKTLNRRPSKRWSFYGKSSKKENKVILDNKGSPRSPQTRLTPEPEDITDRLCIRRRWKSNDNFRCVNVFDEDSVADSIPIWKTVGETDINDNNVRNMYSWKGDESPDAPDSRHVPLEQNEFLSPKSPRSLSSDTESSSSDSSSVILLNGSQPQMTLTLGRLPKRTTSCSTVQEYPLQVQATATMQRKSSLRRVAPPIVEGKIPSLEEVKSALRAEAKNAEAMVKMIPVAPANEGAKTKNFKPGPTLHNLLVRLGSSPEKKRIISPPVIQAPPQLRRNLSLGSYDQGRRPAIPPKPVTASAPNMNLPSRNSLGSSSSDSSSPARSEVSSLSQRTLTDLEIDRDRPVDIRCDVDDVLIMDLLKSLDISSLEKATFVREQRCECMVEEAEEVCSRNEEQVCTQGLPSALKDDEQSNEGLSDAPIPDKEDQYDSDKDQEILSQWLRSIHFDEYLGLFVNSGYDMPTISRMTPEDLTAIGITKPTHRRKLFAEISKLNISDGIPDYKPDSLSLLLKLLRLEEYEVTLVSQGYDTVDKVAELTWEDIDDIGIRKLGHQKKLTLAIKKIKNFPKYQPAFRPIPPSSSSHHSLARHSSIDLGNPHARPITVPVPPEQFDQWTPMGTTLQHSVSQTDSFTFPSLRTVGSGSDLQKMELDEQAMYFAWQQQNDQIFSQQPNMRGRSLESLEQNFDWYDMVNSWRAQMLQEQTSHLIEGTSTLNRPRGLVKARPVAKVQGTSTISIRDQIGSSLEDDDGPKSELLAGQGPVPPKRLMSSGVTKQHDVGDAAFATCVQSLTSRFTLDTCEGDLIDDEPALASLASPIYPRPPPPEPPAVMKPPTPQRDHSRSPVPPGDASQVAPQVIELNREMQSELKMKLKQRNAKTTPEKGRQDKERLEPAKDKETAERERFLAKLESVRKKSERKEDGKMHKDQKDMDKRKREGDKDKDRKDDREKKIKDEKPATRTAGNSIENEIRSLQECVASMDTNNAEEDIASQYDTNPFTALLSKIEKNVDKEFLERKRNEKAAGDSSTSINGNSSTVDTLKRLSKLHQDSAKIKVDNGVERIEAIEVKLEGINNLNRERPFEIARSTKTEPVTQNKFFSTIGVETKVINLEDRPRERKSDAGLPSQRSNKTEVDNQRRSSIDAKLHNNRVSVTSIPTTTAPTPTPAPSANAKAGASQEQQLEAAKSEFENKFGNVKICKDSEKEKVIGEVKDEAQEDTPGFREGLVSSARKIFEVCAKNSPNGSASSSPAIPRRNSVKKNEEPPAPPPRPSRPPEVPPRNSKGTDLEGPPPARLPAKNPRRVPETPKVIQDIEHMLSSLTDQLDAMLD